ncbi:MAG TPA: ABC transporter ATP-binding protein [Gemmatimonadales bacterium]
MTASIHEEETLGRSYDARLIRRLIGFLRPYRGKVAVSFSLMVVSAMLQLAGPTLTKIAIDKAIPTRDVGLARTLALLLAGALLIEFVADYTQMLLTARIGQNAMLDLRMAIFGKLQRLDVAFYDRNPVGRLMTRVTSDVEALNDLFTTGVVQLLGDALTLSAIMVWMFVTDWRLGLATIVVLPGVAFTAQKFRVRMRDAYRDIRVRLARINAFLQEHLSGMRVVQLFGREGWTAKRHQEVNAAHLEAQLRSIAVFAWLFPVIEVLIAVALASLLITGGHRVLIGGLTIGVLAAFLQLARRFFQPMQDLAEKLNALQSAVTSSERIFQLLDTPEAIVDTPTPKTLRYPVRGEVTFEDVWFRYPQGQGPAAGVGGSPEQAKNRWVLKGVSFVARPGTTVALVGHTGAGKTTILSLLMRYYDVEKGRILLDGIDIRELSQAELRGAIGFVQQDIFLFTGDLRSNIALGRPMTDEATMAAAQRVGADRFINRLPDGLSHRLGERGQSLSVGERQLLSFTRALASQPAVLVLDEATSSVDAEAEAAIQEATRELMSGRTCIVVAHRLSTVQFADEILVLHQGVLRERGTHQSLLAQSGLYEKLYHLQLGPSLTPML